MALKGFSFTSLTKYIRDLVAGIAAFTAIKCTGAIVSGNSVNVSASNPIMVLKDTNETGAAQTGYLSFRDNADAEKAWVGYGSVSDTFLSMRNNQGKIRLIGAGGTQVDGDLNATGNIFSNGIVASTNGNIYSRGKGSNAVHLWFQNEDGTERGLIYADTRYMYLRNSMGSVQKTWKFLDSGNFTSQGNIETDGSFYSHKTGGTMMGNASYRDFLGYNPGANLGAYIASGTGNAIYSGLNGSSPHCLVNGKLYKMYHQGNRPTTENTGVNDKDYPVGTILLCANADGARNQIVGVIFDGDSAYAADPSYTTHAQRLAGTWRVHGRMFYDGGNWRNAGLVQRVA